MEEDRSNISDRDEWVESWMKSLQELLRVTAAKRSEHLKFNLYNFNIFRKSKQGEAIMFFGRSPALILLIALPYIIGSELAFFRERRFFVKLKKQVVGIFVLPEDQDALYVASLGVIPEYREHGVATFIIGHCTEIARRIDKNWLELTVLKANNQARRLYESTGFFRKEQRR